MTGTLKDQFEFERASALRLKSASTEERQALYERIYGEYYARFGNHDLPPNPARQLQFLRHFLSDNAVFVEIGPGSCDTLIEAAKLCREAIGIEAATQRTERQHLPANVTILQSRGTDWPLADASADVVYSNQVLEHLHPDDCAAIARTAYRVLRQGGYFVAVTPHNLTGPHDVSREFSDIACGLHLIEYDNATLGSLLRRTGFFSVTAFSGARGTFLPVPLSAISKLERSVALLPKAVRRAALMRALVGIRLVAKK
jgi:SAM-dependent methyltransferase